MFQENPDSRVRNLLEHIVFLFLNYLLFQNRFNYSAPSTLTRNPSCAICRSSSEGEVRSRYASVGTSTRVDNLEAAASKKSSQQEKQGWIEFKP